MVVITARRVIVVTARRGERSYVRIFGHRLRHSRGVALRNRPTTATNRRQRQTNHRERYETSRHGRKIYDCLPSEKTRSKSTLARCLARRSRQNNTTDNTAVTSIGRCDKSAMTVGEQSTTEPMEVFSMAQRLCFDERSRIEARLSVAEMADRLGRCRSTVYRTYH